MAKSKKKNRKLRRQIRKTIGALLMVSAITVAAIPVNEIEAASPEKVKVVNYENKDMNSYEKINGTEVAPATWQSKVPYVADDATIYTDETGTFQFAFIPASATAVDDVAVILGITSENISGGNLTIPDTVDAYKKYSANSTSSGYCAVSRRDKYLYYQENVHQKGTDGAYLFIVEDAWVLDEAGVRVADQKEDLEVHSKMLGMSQDTETGDWHYTREEKTGKKIEVSDPTTGNITYEDEVVVQTYYAKPITDIGYTPCYRENIGDWEGETLYYWEKEGVTEDIPEEKDYFHAVSEGDNTNKRIYDAEVRYIGRQNVIGEGGEWRVGSVADENAKENGVFYNNGQIVNLTIGDKLIGIGDYAFYRCTGLQSVTLGSNLNTIGNGAFANCNNMKNFQMEVHSQISAIGKEAFLGCQGLTEIQIPVSVEAIGDGCFAGCSGLRNIYMCAELSTEENINSNLSTIGIDAFKDCRSLESLTFPESYSEKLPVTYMEGCTGLQYLKSNNRDFDIIDGEDYSTEDTAHGDGSVCDITTFLQALQYADEFYFEGEDDYEIHKTARDHSAAFKYAEQDWYEKVVKCPEDEGHEATYVVNSNCELIKMTLDPNCQEVEIPASIGRYGIKSIAASSFKDNCFLKKITIPNSIEFIESSAFQGCHNLKYVIFLQPNNPNLVIGPDAFNTQAVSSHMVGCDGHLDSEPFLSFTGDISYESAPFQYAMDAGNNINIGSQEMNSYITFYSGWPTNLTVKYNPDTQKNELIDYPRYADLTRYEKFDLDTSDRNSLPYITDEFANAAAGAVGAVDAYNADNTNPRPTQDQWDIVNSALNVYLPAGIEAIAPGIFSGVDSEKEQATEYVYEQDPSSGEWKKVERNLARNDDIQSVTTNTVDTIDPYTFSDCEDLTGFYMSGGNKIDDYAFNNCEKLVNVNVADTVTELGLRPFAECISLQHVEFGANPNFICQDAVIYGTTGGVKDTIVECLETRGLTIGNTQVGPDELAGITTIQEEAFKNCDGIGSVDLTSSVIEDVPRQGFAQTDKLYSVLLPGTAESIDVGAFWNSSLAYIKIPETVTFIEPEAFANVAVDGSDESDDAIILDEDGDPTIIDVTSGHSVITAYCTENSAAEKYAEKYYYINPTYYEPEIYHTVYFWDNYLDKTNPVLLDTQQVLDGQDAVPPEPPVHPGEEFKGWSPSYQNIVKGMDIVAQYGSEVYEVKFVDTIDGKELSVQLIEKGMSATPPEAPKHDGYTFREWAPDYHNITGEITILAQYDNNSLEGNRHVVTFYTYDGKTIVSQQKVDHEAAATAPMPPVRDGYKFIGWVPGDYTKVTKDMNIVASYEPITNTNTDKDKVNDNPNNKNDVDNDKNSQAEATKKKYTVSVSGGSGSGSYAAGDIVAINAYYRGTGQSFDRWTTSTAGVGFANDEASSTTFTMPATNVAVTATYKVGGGNTATTPSGTATGGTPGTTSNGNVNGSSVQITKPGISNTGLAGATVSGATDNFIVKVTEDQNATNAVVTALQTRFGDISRIKYWPMDISLYDSTGRTKIADTSGISVNLTLPIPDELVQYAGNNKVAVVSGGVLEDLNTRFTTVDGVPCVNFTASHFSPYVIYVDTANLSAGTIDATPKTGDGIHPKWFLSIGMACIALVLFFKRDKAVIPVKTA